MTLEVLPSLLFRGRGTQCLAKSIPQLLYKLPPPALGDIFLNICVRTNYDVKKAVLISKNRIIENLENPQLPPCNWGFCFTYYYLLFTCFFCFFSLAGQNHNASDMNRNPIGVVSLVPIQERIIIVEHLPHKPTSFYTRIIRYHHKSEKNLSLFPSQPIENTQF